MQCLKPYHLKDDGGTVPCGKCPNCAARRVSGWSFRLMQQNKVADNAIFLTLTYDTKFVPLTKKGYMTLSKTEYTYRVAVKGKRKGQLVRQQVSSHLQTFFKDLRYAMYGSKKGDLKYYACGEYGSKYQRPHYHVILFNADITKIQDAWPHGYIHYGLDVNEASVGYTLKYMSKPSKIPMHSNDDRVKEFALMSKGLGANYINQEMIEYHNRGHDYMVLTLPDGKKVPMPRYYKDKLYDEYTRIIFGKLSLEKMQTQKNKLLSKYCVTIEEYEARIEEQTEAMYRNQLIKSAARQKIF